MKKVWIAVVLLAALVGVSYLKAHREDQRQAQTFWKGYSKGTAKTGAEQQRADSLENLVTGQRTAMADSLQERDRLYSAGVDSLTAIIEARDRQLTQLQERSNKEAGNEEAAVKKKSSAADDGHHRILAYYKVIIDDLPKDLTSYEKRVAVDEVRQQTAEKFQITVAYLNGLRQQHNINY